MFDTVYYYHHPNEIPLSTRMRDRGGFYNPFDLVVQGLAEWKRTGEKPPLDKLADRLQRWSDDLDYLDFLIESGRPQTPTNPLPPDVG